MLSCNIEEILPFGEIFLRVKKARVFCWEIFLRVKRDRIVVGEILLAAKVAGNGSISFGKWGISNDKTEKLKERIK